MHLTDRVLYLNTYMVTPYSTTGSTAYDVTYYLERTLTRRTFASPHRCSGDYRIARACSLPRLRGLLSIGPLAGVILKWSEWGGFWVVG